jgi:hypothetical protein
MGGGWGDGHGLADDIPVPVVLCALGFGCGGTPKSAGEGVQWGVAAGAINTVRPLTQPLDYDEKEG